MWFAGKDRRTCAPANDKMTTESSKLSAGSTMHKVIHTDGVRVLCVVGDHDDDIHVIVCSGTTPEH